MHIPYFMESSEKHSESIRFNASAVVFPVGEDVNHRFHRLVIRESPVAREMSTSPTSARPRKKRRKVGGGDTCTTDRGSNNNRMGHS